MKVHKLADNVTPFVEDLAVGICGPTVHQITASYSLRGPEEAVEFHKTWMLEHLHGGRAASLFARCSPRERREVL
jgi:hypothetical protein